MKYLVHVYDASSSETVGLVAVEAENDLGAVEVACRVYNERYGEECTALDEGDGDFRFRFPYDTEDLYIGVTELEFDVPLHNKLGIH